MFLDIHDNGGNAMDTVTSDLAHDIIRQVDSVSCKL